MDGLQNSFLSALYGHYRALYGQKIRNENGRGKQVSQNTRIYMGGFYALFSVSYGLNLTGLPNR